MHKLHQVSVKSCEQAKAEVGKKCRQNLFKLQ